MGAPLTHPRIYDFWAWSLVRYRRPGAEPVLLDLQDRFDCNVNILLWSCWCAEHFDVAPEPVIGKAIFLTAEWNNNVTGKLRQVRRYLKANPAVESSANIDDLRMRVKQVELDAEKVEQRRLQDLATSTLAPTGDDSEGGVRARARQNLSGYAALTGVSQKKDFTAALLQSLIGNIFSAPSSAPASKEHRDE